MITCRCGAPLAPSATGCPRCGARPLGRPQARHQAPQHQATHHQAPQHQARHLPQPGPRAVPQSAVATMVRPVPVLTAPPAAAPFVPPPPAPAPSGGTPAWMGWTVAVAGLLVVGLLAAVAVLVLRPTTVTVAAPAPVTTTRTVAPSAPTDDTVSGYRSGSTDTEATSAALLAEGVEADRASVESLVGSWVPQLSSKRLGTVADGITYDSTAILGHYNELSDRYGPVRLVDSGDWPVFRESDYWVVVAAQPFSTAARANAWCSAQGLGADDCFAKRLAHSGTSADNTGAR